MNALGYEILWFLYKSTLFYLIYLTQLNNYVKIVTKLKIIFILQVMLVLESNALKKSPQPSVVLSFWPNCQLFQSEEVSGVTKLVVLTLFLARLPESVVPFGWGWSLLQEEPALYLLQSLKNFCRWLVLRIVTPQLVVQLVL